MTRHWQLMRDAQTFLDASKLANDALIGIHFAEIARGKGQPLGKAQLEKVEKGIKLLDVMFRRLRQEKNRSNLT
jgi:hypothetical protein